MPNIEGWTDHADEESEHRALKRQTLLKESNRKHWVKSDRGDYTIVDSDEDNGYLTVLIW